MDLVSYLIGDVVKLHNLCAMEINEIRPFFVRGMGVLTQLTREPAGDNMDQTT